MSIIAVFEDMGGHFSSAVLKKFLRETISAHEDYCIRHYNKHFFDSVLFYFLHFYCRDRMYCKLCDVRFLSCFSSVAKVLHISFHDMIGNMQNVRCWLIFAVSAPGVVAGIISRYCYCHAVFRILSRRNLPSLACGFLVCTDERLHHSVQRKVNAIPVCRE